MSGKTRARQRAACSEQNMYSGKWNVERGKGKHKDKNKEIL